MPTGPEGEKRPAEPMQATAPTAIEIAAAPAVDPFDIRGRLESFKELRDGWADGMQPAAQWGEGFGKAPRPEGLDWLAGRFAAHYSRDLPKPYLYPTPEGGVSVEWSLGPFEPSIDVDLEMRSADWHCLDLQTGHSWEKSLALNDAGAWEWLAQELRRLESPASG